MQNTNDEHASAEIEEAAQRFEQLADALDIEAAEVDHMGDLRQIADISEALHEGEVRLQETVNMARARGRSWNQIAIALGVSRQAARQRFAHKAHA